MGLEQWGAKGGGLGEPVVSSVGGEGTKEKQGGGSRGEFATA